MAWLGRRNQSGPTGTRVIMTPNDYCYFDYYQSEDTGTNHLPSEALSHWKKVYSLNPTASLTEEQAKHILGTQANLWTEYIPTSEQVEYMVLPRMAALAEVQWTQQEKKDYTNFHYPTGRTHQPLPERRAQLPGTLPTAGRLHCYREEVIRTGNK